MVYYEIYVVIKNRYGEKFREDSKCFLHFENAFQYYLFLLEKYANKKIRDEMEASGLPQRKSLKYEVPRGFIRCEKRHIRLEDEE